MNPDPVGPSNPSQLHTASRQVWNRDQISALGAQTDVPTAGSILGIGRSTAYELVRRGEFPVPVIRVGTKIIVPVAGIVRLLGLEDDRP